MSSELLAHFVDGSGVDMIVNFEERLVEMSAFDETTRLRYKLTFSRCLTILASFKEDATGDSDHYNLTEGVSELQATTCQARRFRIGFVDESVLEIECRDFSMEAVPGGRYPDE